MVQDQGFWLPTGAAPSMGVNLSHLLRAEAPEAAGMMQTEGPVLTQSLTNLCYIFIVGQKSTEYANVKEKKFLFWKKTPF